MKRFLALAALAVTSAAHAQQTFNFTADTIGAVDTFGDVDNQFRTSGPSPSTYQAGTFTFTSATLTEVNTATFASDAVIRARNSGYTGATEFVDLQPFSIGSYTGSTSLAAPISFSSGFFRNKPIAAGSTWSFEFADTFGDGTAGLVEQNFTNLNFRLNSFVPATPPTATPLSVLDSSSVYATADTTVSVNVAAGGVSWYSFTLGSALASPSFLDFDTTAGTAGTDTEIALYDSTGRLVSTDDDDGPANFSALSFGDTTARGPIGTGVAGNGRDGATLASGTYYLAVSSYNAAFGDDFVVTSSSTTAANYTLNVRSNIVGNPVPEPASLAILGVGALALMRRRRASK